MSTHYLKKNRYKTKSNIYNNTEAIKNGNPEGFPFEDIKYFCSKY